MERFQPPSTPSPLPAPVGPKRRWPVPPSLSSVSVYSTLMLSPAVLRETTRDCGVQVNARVDKCVQCSLGPRILFCPDRRSAPGQTRTPRRGGVSSSVSPEERCSSEDEEKETPDKESPQEDPGSSSQEDKEGPYLSYLQEKSAILQKEKEKGCSLRVKKSMDEFLEQKYGFFHCKQCNIRWESAHVWCIAETSKVYYKQLCRQCRSSLNPFRVETILCKGCSQRACICDKKQRHIDLKKPHRQDLCCRCKEKRQSAACRYAVRAATTC